MDDDSVGQMADWLPDGWEMKTKIAADGTRQKYYTSKHTGQKFHSAADMARYANYLKNVEPHLKEFKKAYMDADQFLYEHRPWETDPVHTVADYIQGRVKPPPMKAAEAELALETEEKQGEETAALASSSGKVGVLSSEEAALEGRVVVSAAKKKRKWPA